MMEVEPSTLRRSLQLDTRAMWITTNRLLTATAVSITLDTVTKVQAISTEVSRVLLQTNTQDMVPKTNRSISITREALEELKSTTRRANYLPNIIYYF